VSATSAFDVLITLFGSVGHKFTCVTEVGFILLSVLSRARDYFRARFEVDSLEVCELLFIRKSPTASGLNFREVLLSVRLDLLSCSGTNKFLYLP
jgi:hypothetical protein